MSKVNIETIGSEIDKADLQERADGLAKEIQAMLGKYEFFIGAVPGISPDGRLEAKPIFISSRKPLPAEDAKAEPAQEEKKTDLID